MTVRIKPEQPLVEQHINRLSSGVFDHEFGARLAKDRRRLVDQLAGVGLDPQIDATFGLDHGRARRDCDGCSATAFRAGNAVFSHRRNMAARIYNVNTPKYPFPRNNT